MYACMYVDRAPEADTAEQAEALQADLEHVLSEIAGMRVVLPERAS